MFMSSAALIRKFLGESTESNVLAMNFVNWEYTFYLTYLSK